MTKLTQINGKEIELNIQSEHSKWHFETPQNYTKEILEEWQTQPYKDYLSKEDKIILDIGANVGLFALHVLPFVEQIVCVEPTESHNQVFEDLMQGNKKVVLESSALHNYTGTVGYHIEPVNYTMNRVNVHHAGAIEVPCITLYDLCKKYNLTNVDFCKIDIEGSEDLAITVETVKPVNHIIKKFSIELHPRTFEMMEKYETIFQEAGYKTQRVDFNTTIFAFK
jgi:FkbM family methyltransferase